MQRSIILFYLFLLTSAWVLTRCANPVSPQGGPKDSTPPRVISCDPPNMATKFEKRSFTVNFNEFITLKNPATEIFISPPFRSPLEPRLRGKSLVVKLEDSLAPNTTYSITFGNAITDLTEGNILKGFNYVFSTGDYIDTLSLQGTLKTAFDLKPQKDVFVELFYNNNDTLPLDSLPLKVAPYYITKTDEQGNFTFHNLQNEKFKLFALSDQNGDLIFNQPSEKIAFYDSLVSPYYIPVSKPDTSKKDSVEVDLTKITPTKIKNPDSLRKSDSIHKADSIKQNYLLYPSFPLFLFEETDSIQRLVKATFPIEGMVLLAFRFPIKDFRVVPLNFDSISPWYIPEISPHRDSVRLWITRPKVDSLVGVIILGDKIVDTVNLEVTKKTSLKKSKGDIPGRLNLENPANSGLNQYKDTLEIRFSYPLIRWDFTKVLLVSGKDTLHPEIVFADSLKRKIRILHKWEEDKGYKIVIPDSVFWGIHDFTHDSVFMNFSTKGENDFGNLIVAMNLDKRPGQYIVQLLNDSESTVYEEKVLNASATMRFEFMVPGKYKLKAISDRNRNRKWDTGNYRSNIQPEVVLYYYKTLEIRANWDVEETWD